jgi:multiple sugar transport system permease protein
MTRERSAVFYKRRKKVKRTISLFLIAVVLLVCVLPYLWTIINGFKPSLVMFTKTPLKPFEPTLENFEKAIERYKALKYLKNSIIIATGNTIIALGLGIPAAYAFSRFKYVGKQFLLMFILATTMVPPITLAVPMFIFFSKIGLIDRYLGIIMADATYNVVLSTWLMKGFFDELPSELEESAKIDGASQIVAFYRISLPLVRSGIVTVSIFSFIFSWNDLLYTLILTGDNTRTLTATIPLLIIKSGTLWGVVSSIAVFQTVPIIAFTFIILNNLVRGLTFGAVKG